MLDKTAIVNAAQKFSSKGQIDKAIGEWEKLLEEKKDGNIHNNIGDLYLRKGSENEAIEAFTNAAEVFKKEGFFPKAIALHKKILNIMPHNVDSLIALAKLNTEKGLVGNAVENYFKAAELFQREGATEKTVMAIEKIVQLSPTDINTRKKIADLYIRSGHKERAANEYAEIAAAFYQKEDDEKALEYYQNTIELDMENVPALIGLSKLSERADDLDKAFDYLEQALPFDPDNLELLTVYARLSLKTGNNDGAMKALTVLVESDPDDLELKKQLGNIYVELEQLDDAWEVLLPCIEDASTKQNWDEALTLLNNFKELDPIPVRERIVEICKMQGDNDALKIGLTELAGLYKDKDRNKDALKSYKEILELSPDDSKIINTVKELENSMGIAQSAVELSESAHEEVSSGNEMMSDLLMSTHEHSEAGNTIQPKPEDASQMNDLLMTNDLISPDKSITEEDDPQNNIKISPIEFAEKESEADFLVQQGMNDEAIIIFKELLSLFPGNAGITKKLEALNPHESGAGTGSDEDDNDLQDIFSKFGKEEPSVEVEKKEAAPDNDLQDVFSEFGKEEPSVEVEKKDAPPTNDLQDIFSEFGKEEPAVEVEKKDAPPANDLQDIFNELGKDEPSVESEKKDTSASSDLQDIFSEFEKDEPSVESEKKETSAGSDLQDIFSEFEKKETPAGSSESNTPADNDLQNIFDQFESKEEIVEKVDYEASYSAALDYKQKGLFDEAIKEFQTTANDPERKTICLSMIALCYMGKNDYPHAIEEFNKILQSMSTEDTSYLRIKYELAKAYMQNKEHNKALEIYTEILAKDQDFKDCSKKIEEIKSLIQPPQKKPSEESPEKPKTKKSRVSYI